MSVLREAEINELKDRAVQHTFRKGQRVVTRHENATGMYCIRTGIVKLYYDSIQTDNVTVFFRKEGDTVGHHGIHHETQMFSATCVTDAEACFFPKETILHQSRKNPELITKINSLLNEDIDELSSSLSVRFYKSTNQRLGDAILKLKNILGVNDDNYIAMPLTRQELADMIGASIESVFRALATLKTKKLIEVKNQQIRILDERSLKDFINKKN